VKRFIPFVKWKNDSIHFIPAMDAVVSDQSTDRHFNHIRLLC